MPDITDIIGRIPYRMAFAGGWIDQPFASRLNPDPPGSMVVVNIEPTVRFMDRCGMGTSTRTVAARLWGPELPDRDPADLVRELYVAENAGQARAERVAGHGRADLSGREPTGLRFRVRRRLLPLSRRVVHRRRGSPVARARHVDRAGDAAPAGLQPAGHPQPGARVGAPAEPVGQELLRGNRRTRPARPGRIDERVDALLGVPAAPRRPPSHHHRRSDGSARAITRRATPARCTRAAAGGYLYVVSEEPVPGGFQVRVRTAGEGSAA